MKTPPQQEGQKEKKAPCQERERLWSEGPNGEIIHSFCCFDCKEWFATEAGFREHARTAMNEFALDQMVKQELLENSLRGNGEF